MRHFLLALFLFLVRPDWTHATDYYVSTTGARSGANAFATPWAYSYCLTQQVTTFILGVDRIVMRGGTYLGDYRDAPYGGTNAFYWSALRSGSSGPLTNYVTTLPYNNERVIIDCRKFRIKNSSDGNSFQDLEFTDSTRNTKNYRQDSMMDSAIGAYSMKFINCFIYDCSTCPGTCNYMYGCDGMQVGSDELQHTIYTQTTDPTLDAIITGNVFWSTGGDAMKLIDGGYRLTVSSNIVINPGKFTWPPGQNTGIMNQPGAGFTNANSLHIFRNWLLTDTETASTSGNTNGQRPMLWLANNNIDSLNLSVHHNWLEMGTQLAIQVGNGGSSFGRNLYGSRFVTNTILGAWVGWSSDPYAMFMMRWGASSPMISDAVWDYNTYKTTGAAAGVSDALWQWNNAGVADNTLTLYTNDTVGGIAGHLDVNSTLSKSTTVASWGDQFEVLPDPVTVGRGHLLAINNTLGTTHAFDLTPLGLLNNQAYTFIYSGSLAQQSRWVTNTWLSASPTLTVTMTDAAYPMSPYIDDGNSTNLVIPFPAASNSLPRFGAWLVYPAPIAPTISVTMNGGHTVNTLGWVAANRASGVLINRSVNGGAYSVLTNVAMPNLSALDGTVSGTNNYTYTLSAYNGYSLSTPSDPVSDLTPTRAPHVIAWSGSSRWSGVLLNKSINGGAFSLLTNAVLPVQSVTDTAVFGTNQYAYYLVPYNGYSLGTAGATISDSGVSPIIPGSFLTPVSKIYNFFYRTVRNPLDISYR